MAPRSSSAPLSESLFAASRELRGHAPRPCRARAAAGSPPCRSGSPAPRLPAHRGPTRPPHHSLPWSRSQPRPRLLCVR